MTKKYRIMKISENSWHSDGSPIIEHDCGHNHRTLSGAARCLDRLIAYNPRTRMWSAKWCAPSRSRGKRESAAPRPPARS